MNSELQAQSDAITGAIRHLETALHQDALLLLAMAVVSAFLVILILVTLIRRR